MESIKLVPGSRIVAFGSLGAFFLSLLVGLVSKNPIGIAVVRGVVSSLVFGIILFGVAQIVRRYIPELLVTGKNGGKPTSAEEHGALRDVSMMAGDKAEADNVPPEVKGEAASHANTESGLQLPETKFDGESDEDLPSNDSSDGLPSLDQLIDEDEESFGVEEVATKSAAPTGDYIDVGDVKIPNEPEILAKAVKQVMKQDEYE